MMLFAFQNYMQNISLIIFVLWRNISSICIQMKSWRRKGKPNGEKGYLPIAFIVLKKDADRGRVIAELKKLCRRELPENSLPYKYCIVDEFPLTAAGKVDYRALEKKLYIFSWWKNDVCRKLSMSGLTFE